MSCKKSQIPAEDTLVMGVPATPQTIDPRYAMDSFGHNLRGLLFASLVRLSNSGPNNSLVPVPDLATDWTIKNTSYIFKIRENIKFSDGTPITHEDIRFSIETFQLPASPFAPTFKKIKTIVFDKNQLTLTTEAFESTFFLDIAFLPILPKKVIEQYGDNFYQHLTGSGPFRLVSADESAIQLEANPHSHLQPKMKKVLFKIIRDDNSRFLRMYKGDLDIVINDMPSTKVSTFAQNTDKFFVKTLPGGNITYLLLNLRDPLLQKKEIREAVAHAINKEDIIKYKLENLAIPADTFVLPNSAFFDSSLQLPEYSLEKAKKIFSALNKIPELEIKTSNQRSAVENGKMLAYQLEQAGAQVSLKSYEWGTYYADIKKGNFQISTMKAVGLQDPDLYRLMFHSEQVPPHGLNRGHYINKELDPLLIAGNRIADTEKRVTHYNQIQKIVLRDLPMIPLWYDKYVAIMNKRITNFEPSPQTGFSFLFTIEKTQNKTK
ncbi:MAG: ABC transporter substrate-binding protein [Bdellovibrionaceae bacterium]|nr:ABC transporter substrate-binding protein [Pseudobdellovibrionaceae bacterium]